MTSHRDRHFIPCDLDEIDRIAFRDGVDFYPSPVYVDDAEGKLSLLDEIASQYLCPVDQLIYIQVIRRGMSCKVVAPATGLSASEVSRRSKSVLRHLRAIVHAPPVPEVEPDDTDAQAAVMFVEWKPLATVAKEMGLADKHSARRAILRGAKNGPKGLAACVDHRRSSGLLRHSDARREIVNG